MYIGLKVLGSQLKQYSESTIFHFLAYFPKICTMTITRYLTERQEPVIVMFLGEILEVFFLKYCGPFRIDFFGEYA